MSITGDSSSTKDDQEQQLTVLLARAMEAPDIETLKALLSIYTSTLDWITQERIEVVIANADKELWVKIILLEMPRLVVESPSWAVSLLGEEVENRSHLVQECLASMPAEVQSAVYSVVNSEDYSSFYANAESLF